MRNQDQTPSSGPLLTLTDSETAAGIETYSVWRYHQHTYSHLSLCISLSSSLVLKTSAQLQIKANKTLEMLKAFKKKMLEEKIKYILMWFAVFYVLFFTRST